MLFDILICHVDHTSGVAVQCHSIRQNWHPGQLLLWHLDSSTDGPEGLCEERHAGAVRAVVAHFE